MKNKKILASVVMLAALAGTARAETLTREEAALKTTFPNMTVDSFRSTPVDGIFEVVAGDQIFYFSPQGYLFFGEMWSKDGKSITAERKQQLMAQKIKTIPLEKAVKIGNGKNIIIQFTDPDCPFCRKAEEFFSNRTDVTRYVFFLPLRSIHPGSANKCRYVLCSSDREKTYEEVLSGKTDEKQLRIMPVCKEELLTEHEKLAQALGVRGTPAFWVNGNYVSGADFERIAALLKGKEVQQ